LLLGEKVLLLLDHLGPSAKGVLIAQKPDESRQGLVLHSRELVDWGTVPLPMKPVE